MFERNKKNISWVLVLAIVSLLLSTLGLQESVYAETSANLDHIFSYEGLYMNGSSGIDGDVATNTTARNSIRFTGTAQVKGNLLIGPNADWPTVVWKENKNPHDDVTGTISNLEEPLEYPMPQFPSYPQSLPQRGNFSTPWVSGEYYEINQDGMYNEIEVTSDRTLTIDLKNQTRVIRVKNLEIKQGHIKLKNKGENGRLILYVENSFTLNGSSTINYSGDYNDVFMFYGGSDLKMHGDTKFVGCIFAKNAKLDLNGSGGVSGHIVTGGSLVDLSGNVQANTRAVYAPNALVALSGSSRIYGTVIARDIELKGHSWIHFSDAMDMSFFELIGLNFPSKPTPTPQPEPRLKDISLTSDTGASEVNVIKLNGDISEKDKVVNAKISFELLEETSLFSFKLSGIANDKIGTVKAYDAQGVEYTFTKNGDYFTYSGTLRPSVYKILFGISVVGISSDKNIQVEEIKIKGADFDEAIASDSYIYLNNSLRIDLADINIGLTASTKEPTVDPVNVKISYVGEDIWVKQYKIGADGEWKDYTGSLSISENTTVYARAGIIDINETTIYTNEVSYIVDNILALDDINIISLDVEEESSGQDKTVYLITIKHSLIDSELIVGYDLYIEGQKTAYKEIIKTGADRTITFKLDNIDKKGYKGYISTSLENGQKGPRSKDFLITYGSYAGVAIIDTKLDANAKAYIGNKSATTPVFIVGDNIIVPFKFNLDSLLESRDLKLEVTLNTGEHKDILIPAKIHENGLGNDDYFNLKTETPNVQLQFSDLYRNQGVINNSIKHQIIVSGDDTNGGFKTIEKADVTVEMIFELNQKAFAEKFGRTREKKEVSLVNRIKLSYINKDGVLVVMFKDLDIEIPVYPVPQAR